MNARLLMLVVAVCACGILQTMSLQGVINPTYNITDYTAGVVGGATVMLFPDIYSWLNKYLRLD